MKKAIFIHRILTGLLVIFFGLGPAPDILAQTQSGRYAEVNGIKMYYEVHGSGSPLVLLHGGSSTIQTSFGRILSELARTHQVIAIELQAHGHTGDRDNFIR